ncbi:transcriptional regulator [Paraburkholderia sp. MM5477-R1]|uniref:transcriptional regulator n=1 Tax=Paraburkholderia sp. MM5477-R1 TaxID=2991062 RepID=UPI003D22B86D
MRLIEPDERHDFVAALQRRGLAESDFEFLETDTTDPKGDENFGLQGYVTVTRLSIRITREYPIGYEADWVQHFSHDLDAGVFATPA